MRDNADTLLSIKQFSLGWHMRSLVTALSGLRQHRFIFGYGHTRVCALGGIPFSFPSMEALKLC